VPPTASAIWEGRNVEAGATGAAGPATPMFGVRGGGTGPYGGCGGRSRQVGADPATGEAGWGRPPRSNPAAPPGGGIVVIRGTTLWPSR
jgi:hypothetical protein